MSSSEAQGGVRERWHAGGGGGPAGSVHDNLVLGNLIGTDRTGTSAVPNTINGIRVEFCDRGRPFDPADAPPPDLSRIGGLGIHLVRNIMRDFAYQRAGEWNRIVNSFARFCLSAPI